MWQKKHYPWILFFSFVPRAISFNSFVRTTLFMDMDNNCSSQTTTFSLHNPTKGSWFPKRPKREKNGFLGSITFNNLRITNVEVLWANLFWYMINDTIQSEMECRQKSFYVTKTLWWKISFVFLCSSLIGNVFHVKQGDNPIYTFPFLWHFYQNMSYCYYHNFVIEW